MGSLLFAGSEIKASRAYTKWEENSSGNYFPIPCQPRISF